VPPLAQYGRLPLYYALKHAGPEVVLALLPSDVAAKDSTQSYLLLKEFAERREQVLPVLLADVSAQVLRHPKSEHSTAVDGDKEIADTFYSWSKLVSGTQDMCIEIVRAILEKYNDDVQMLVDLCDKDGRKAVDIATPKCKALLLSCTQLCGRYTISLNPPEHRSATSVVLRAEDHSPHDFSDIFDEFDRNKNGKLEPKEIADAALSLGICAKLLQGSDQAVSRDEFVSACTKLIGDGPLDYALKKHAGPEVVLALLHSSPGAASTPDEVRCGADVRSVSRECLCAAMYFRCKHMCMGLLYQFVNSCTTTHMRTSLLMRAALPTCVQI